MKEGTIRYSTSLSGIAFHFKGERSLVERHLYDMARADPKMEKKIKDCLKSLERYGRI